mmetsp:Transcript_34629/g.79246  ORF Transcript_34629/g.79246 Transcript_34629/m.79246 type:complete len:214 (-) Transcript_34629:432-1073(-)
MRARSVRTRRGHGHGGRRAPTPGRDKWEDRSHHGRWQDHSYHGSWQDHSYHGERQDWYGWQDYSSHGGWQDGQQDSPGWQQDVPPLPPSGTSPVVPPDRTEPPVPSVGAAHAGMIANAAGTTAGVAVAAVPIVAGCATGHTASGVILGGNTGYNVGGKVQRWMKDWLAPEQKCSKCSRDFRTTMSPPYFCEECRDKETHGSGAGLFDIFGKKL